MTEYSDYENEIDLGSIIKLLWKKLWIMALAAVIVTAAVFVVAPNNTTETFIASTDLYVGYTDEYAEGKPDLNTAIQSGAAIIQSQQLLESAAESAGLKLSIQQLQTMVNVSVVDKSRLIHLEVSSTDGDQAAALADAIVETTKLRVAETMSYAEITQLSEILLNSDVSGSNRAKYSAMAGVVTAIVLALVLVIREIFDRRIKDSGEAANITGLPVLAVIPERKEDRGHKEARPRLAAAEVSAQCAEAYKSLRTSVMFAAEENGMKSLAVTSSVPGENAYNTAVELAFALAAAGKNTVIVDCDMRSGALGEYIELKQGPGVKEILSGQAELAACISTTSAAHLRAIRSGDVSLESSELLSSDALGKMLHELRKENDYVIAVAPPASMYTDATLLAKETDGVLMVTRTRFVKREVLCLAIENIKAVKGRVIGIVLTRFDPSKSYGSNAYAQMLKME